MPLDIPPARPPSQADFLDAAGWVFSALALACFALAHRFDCPRLCLDGGLLIGAAVAMWVTSLALPAAKANL